MIRDFNKDDLERIMKLWLETNLQAHDFIEGEYWRGHYEMVKQMLPQANLFVWEDSRDIQGFIGLMDNYIAGIFVDAACQSRGVGKALLDYVKRSHDELSLQVYKHNVHAVEFYSREGFTVEKEQQDGDTGEAELVMGWRK
ncbi:N-acetyltransferase [Aminipila butyrica]|uniref:N-acetyltransferase n=1 Tax=Aminipila butyrica TaxID=433296 RepID=A0A858BXV2_9FIRM|nr:N-acetyltransferase [Aminipila butyrica]QIB69925.1 N-acetyltransferase [Aminipila butyrica]